MKILNIGILAHVDAGKTTLTESLLYASGAIAKPGSVDSGTTHTDTMELERQRGITIQTAVTSFRWRDCKINLVDTPGHMDFVAEVYRSLAVLDGAVLVVSARDGVQAQTRVLFYALQKMGIPTVIFVNKIDQPGIDLGAVRQSIRDKLDIGILVKQKVVFSPLPTLLAEEPSENRDMLISGSDSLLKQYLAGKEITRKELDEEELLDAVEPEEDDLLAEDSDELLDDGTDVAEAEDAPVEEPEAEEADVEEEPEAEEEETVEPAEDAEEAEE